MKSETRAAPNGGAGEADRSIACDRGRALFAPRKPCRVVASESNCSVSPVEMRRLRDCDAR